jgi:hypothetical protein
MSFYNISEPCHENWDRMKASEKGRFCSSCNKHVHDLTARTGEEIEHIIHSSSDGLCGRLTGKQLTKSYVQGMMKRKWVKVSRNFCLALVLSFGASLLTFKDASAKSIFAKIRVDIKE